MASNLDTISLIDATMVGANKGEWVWPNPFRNDKKTKNIHFLYVEGVEYLLHENQRGFLTLEEIRIHQWLIGRWKRYENMIFQFQSSMMAKVGATFELRFRNQIKLIYQFDLSLKN